MTQGNMGTYSIGVIADFSLFNQAVLNATQMLTTQTQLMTNMLNTMNVNASKSMQQMAASIGNSTNQASNAIAASTQQTTAALNGLQSSMNNVNTQGMANATSNLTQQHGQLRTALANTSNQANVLGDVFSKLKSHLEYMASGAIIAGLIGMPALMIKTATETETLTQKIRNNLELGDQYHGNNQLLESDLKRLNDVAGTFAVGYGDDLTEVNDAMVLLSRRFKDVATNSYLTSAALTMNKIDFLDLKEGAKGLEAVVLQFGLTSRGTRDFVNQLTVAVHTMNIDAKNLMDALQRSGSSFAQLNMNTAESIAAISALANETARTGSTIGNTFKSIAANFDMKKGLEALDAYGIKLYDVNDQGMKTMRQGANIFQELQGVFAKLDDEGKSKLALAISGGKYQVNAMMSFLQDANGNFQDALNTIKSKSSDAMTQELLENSTQNFATKLKQMQASLQVFAQTIGNQVLPYLKQFATYMTGSVMWLKQHSDSVINVARVLGDLLIAYTAIKTVTLTYATATALVSLYTGMQAIATAGLTGTMALATAGTWAYNAANIAATLSAIVSTTATYGLAAGFTALWTAMGPIGWVVIAITALSIAIYEVYNNWAPILQWMKDTWNTVVSFIADHIGMIMILFPPLGAAILLISIAWEPVVNFLRDLWNGFVSFLQSIGQIFIAIFNGMCTAFPLFVAATKTGISNFTTVIGDLVRSILPAWGNDVINFFVNMGNKIASITAQIGAVIRKNLTVTGINSSGGVGNVPYGPQNKEKTPFELAMEQSEAAYNKMLANNAIPGNGGLTEPEMGNQLTGGSGKDKKAESAYHIAKRAYEEDEAKQSAQAELDGVQFTNAEKLALYQQYLSEVQKTSKENTDYIVGLSKLEIDDKKEKIEMSKSLLDKEIAEGKVKTEEAYRREIVLLNQKVALTKVGSVERIKAETDVLNAIKVNTDKIRDLEIQRLENYRKNALAIMDIEQQRYQILKDNGVITQEQLTKILIQEEDKRYEIELRSLNKELAQFKEGEKGYEETQRKITNLLIQHTKTRATLDNQAFKDSYKYGFAAFDGFKSGLEKIKQGLLEWNMTVKQMFQALGKTILQSLAGKLIDQAINKLTTSAAKALGLGGKDKGSKEEITAETAKQTALTGIATAGDAARLAASKAANLAAGASGAAAATAIVTANAAAFTALLAMITATAAAIAAIPPDGPAMAAAMTAGVATATGVLTGATSAATAGISASMSGLASFDVGSLNVPHDMLAQVHKNEVIIPAPFADSARSFISNGGFSGNGAGGDIFNISIPLTASAIDAKGMDSVLKKHGDTIGKVVQNEIRKFKYKK